MPVTSKAKEWIIPKKVQKERDGKRLSILNMEQDSFKEHGMYDPILQKEIDKAKNGGRILEKDLKNNVNIVGIPSIPSEEEMSSMSHKDLWVLRDTVKSFPKLQEQIAPFEHRAFTREATAENPIIGAGLAELIPAYYAAKKLGLDTRVTDEPSTPASGKQVIESYKGIGEGLMQFLKNKVNSD